MTESKRLPQFVIIGAPKSATTWLLTNLQALANLYMPGPELHFFNRNFDKGMGWYHAQFDAAAPDQILGEKSASYLASPEVPERLRAALPKARLIAQLRNPIERAYSDYCMLVRRGEVSRDIEAYLNPKTATFRRFLDDGLYGRHLAHWHDFVPANELLVIFYDDIRSDPAKVFDAVSGFLRLEDAKPVEPGKKVKFKEEPMLPLGLRRILRPLKGLVRPLRQKSWFKSLRGSLARPTEYPPLTDDLRRRMQDYYAEDVAKLGRLMGRDFSHWLREESRAA